MTILNKLNGWQRLWLLCALLWAFTVVALTVIAFPIVTVSEVNAQWANAKIDLIRKYHGNGEALAEFRKRLHGNASDEEILHPVQKHDGRFDLSTAVPADEALALDVQYQARLTNLGDRSKFKAVAFGFLAWALPVLGIYFLDIAVRWIYVGFRSKSA